LCKTNNDTTHIERLQHLAAERDISVAELIDGLLTSPAHNFFTAATGLLCVLTTESHFHAVNPAFCNALAYTPDDLIGQPFTHIIHPDDHRLVYPYLQAANQMDDDIFEIRVRGGDNVYTWLRFAISPPRDGLFYLTGQDISSHKARETSLEADNEQVKIILESISDAFFALDENWCFTYVNQEAETQLFRNRGDLIGNSVWEEFPEAIGSTFYNEYHQAVREKVAVTFTEYYPPLETWFEVNAYPSANGLSVYFRNVTERLKMEQQLQEMVNILEIKVRERTQELVQANIQLQVEATERQAMEETLREEEERFRVLTENTSDMICMHEPDGTYIYASPSTRALVGYEPEEMIGKDPYSFFHPDDVEMIRTRSHKHNLEGNTSHVIYRFRRKDGSYIWFETISRPVLNEDRQVVRLVTASRDVTIRKQLESELVAALQAERRASELRQHLFSMLSHEFRVPLATILSSADLLRLYQERMTNEQQYTHFARIQSQVKYLTMMIDTIIDLSKAQSVGLTFEPMPTDISVHLDRLIEEMRTMAQPKHRIVYEADIYCGSVHVDMHLLRMIITNLISNALKYSPKADHIEVRVTCDRVNNQLSVTVQDFGIGIPEADQQRIYEHFERASNVGDIKGSGLGLQLTKLALDAHHGDIELQSVEGEGSTFTIHVPMRQPHPD